MSSVCIWSSSRCWLGAWESFAFLACNLALKTCFPNDCCAAVNILWALQDWQCRDIPQGEHSLGHFAQHRIMLGEVMVGQGWRIPWHRLGVMFPVNRTVRHGHRSFNDWKKKSTGCTQVAPYKRMQPLMKISRFIPNAPPHPLPMSWSLRDNTNNFLQRHPGTLSPSSHGHSSSPSPLYNDFPRRNGYAHRPIRPPSPGSDEDSQNTSVPTLTQHEHDLEMFESFIKWHVGKRLSHGDTDSSNSMDSPRLGVPSKWQYVSVICLS